MLLVGFAANLLVRPVDKKFHEHADAVPDHHKADVVCAAAVASKSSAPKAPAKVPAKVSATKGVK